MLVSEVMNSWATHFLGMTWPKGVCPGILVYPWVREKGQDGNNAQSESTWFTDEPFNHSHRHITSYM